MRILDLDLDVFVTPINHIHSSIRLQDGEYELTNQTIIDHFLIDKCGLSSSAPKHGAVFEEHDELFDILKELVESKQLTVPFEVVHVDAHADLGLGQWPPFEYLLTDLMHRPINERSSPVRGQKGLNRGTVLLFIAACEWISKLYYVHHPADGEGVPTLLLDWNDDSDRCSLHVPKCSREDINASKVPFLDWNVLSERCTRGTLIPIESSTLENYCGPEEFDFVFLTRSPGFTPPKADAVFERIRLMIAPLGEKR